MRDALVTYLGELKKENEFNLLLVTGDIANKGGEYGKEINIFLNNIIKEIGVSLTDVHLIPGNHDIERNHTRSLIIDGILNSSNPTQILDSANIDAQTYQNLLNGQSKFFAFYEDLLGIEYPKEKLHFIKSSEQYNVFSLNTCLVSHKKGEEGKLLIGRKKFYEAIREFRELDSGNKLNIAIGHHTLACIDPVEKNSIMSNFEDASIDLYLSGHVHDPAYNLTANMSDSVFVELISGAVVSDEYAVPGFVVVDVDLDSGDAKGTYHIWNSSDDYWSTNNQVGRRTKKDNLEFKLPRLKSHKDVVLESNSTLELEKEESGLQEIDENEFKSFIIDFHEKLNFEGITKSSLDNKISLEKKFFDMKCSETFQKRFEIYSKYFGLIYKIMESTAYVSSDKKELIAEIIIDQYLDIHNSYNNGDKIFKQIVDKITMEYHELLPYTKLKAHRYIKILTAWSIYECDIFNEDKRLVEQ